MSNNARAFRDRVQTQLELMHTVGFVLYFQPPKVEHLGGVRRVTWAGPPGDHGPLFRLSQLDIETYLLWIENGQYSAILRDGSLIQITYEFAGDEVVRHRLLYWPCPFDAETSLVSGEPIADTIRELMTEQMPKCLSPLRFDYDPEAAAENHPAAHLTLNHDDCRVPMTRPMSPDEFLHFTIRHFYSFDSIATSLISHPKKTRLNADMDISFFDDVHLAVGS